MTAWEPYDATHRAIYRPTDSDLFYMGQVGSVQINKRIKAGDEDDYLQLARQTVHAEWMRARLLIDDILADHGIIPDEDWHWVPECAHYRVMKVRPPFEGLLRRELPPLSPRTSSK
ncbi:MAG: hypothetical protein U0487_00085 [Patescibacteria group bacterium]